MKKILAIFTLILSFSVSGSAQFPKLPKINLPKMPTSEVKTPAASSGAENPASAPLDAAARRANSPTAILKPSLTVRTRRDLNYWKQPDLPNFWSWMPQVNFAVSGPVPDASYFTLEFTTPDGKLWYSWDTAPFAVAEGKTQSFESEAVPRWTDTRSSIAVGTFGFRIILKNSLAGTAKEMYRGSFKVNKKFAGTEHRDFKNQYIFYVEQDWALPIGFAEFDTKETEAPMLNLGMWFRGDFDRERLTAHVFHNGKQISATASNNLGVGNSVRSIISEGDDAAEFHWAFWKFTFFNLRSFDNRNNPGFFVMKNNPGVYQVKVLLDGELIRTAEFAIGNKGEIVDNGIAAKNGFGGAGTVIPVKVIPVKEGNLNLNAWKTDAFYANPLDGFSVQ